MKVASFTNPESRITLIARNATTGVIHKIYGSRSMCGSSKRNSPMSVDSVMKAKQEHFCVKCFLGKPEKVYEAVI